MATWIWHYSKCKMVILCWHSQSNGKPVASFYAVGDNIEELVDYGLGPYIKGPKVIQRSSKQTLQIIIA